jgi:hypothetical protein
MKCYKEMAECTCRDYKYANISFHLFPKRYLFEVSFVGDCYCLVINFTIASLPSLFPSLFHYLETTFHLVVQAGLELLGSSDPPASASQVAGTTGICHQPGFLFTFELPTEYPL